MTHNGGGGGPISVISGN
jgi:hypothetical protein